VDAPGLTTDAPQQDYLRCSGCGLCLLVCPVWRRERDIMLTPLARAKALQHGASPAELAASVDSCALCGACEPVCPENIGLVDMTLNLRRQFAQHTVAPQAAARVALASTPPEATLLLADKALRARPVTLARTLALLDSGAVAAEDADDIALALESGAAIPEARLQQFLQPLRRAARVVVADGLLLRYLRAWLPRSQIAGLGEALSRVPAVRAALRPDDLYVIEARAYHADFQRLVKHYDSLRRFAGCKFNLDLQRMAIPASAPSLTRKLGQEAHEDRAQIDWILQGRKVARIVVESNEDGDAFAGTGEIPVVHLADLAEDVRA